MPPGGAVDMTLWSMFVLTAQFPLEAVNDAFDAGLENVSGYTDRSPSLPTVAKNRQNADQSSSAFFIFVEGRAVQQTHVEFFKAHL
jgi:hypothetical protein